jgi:hypothetical protein
MGVVGAAKAVASCTAEGCPEKGPCWVTAVRDAGSRCNDVRRFRVSSTAANQSVRRNGGGAGSKPSAAAIPIIGRTRRGHSAHGWSVVQDFGAIGGLDTPSIANATVSSSIGAMRAGLRETRFSQRKGRPI